jgi:hypothetical protein
LARGLLGSGVCAEMCEGDLADRLDRVGPAGVEGGEEFVPIVRDVGVGAE